MNLEHSPKSYTKQSLLRSLSFSCALIASALFFTGSIVAEDLLFDSFESIEPSVVEWAQSVSSRIDSEAVDWGRKQLDSELTKGEFVSLLQESRSPCSLYGVDTSVDQLELFVLISSSIPERTLADLSKELERVNGAFVIAGLPNQSWTELVSWIRSLESAGVTAPIQIYPQLFSEHRVDQVPLFLVCEESTCDKLAGNVSLEWALERMAEFGETKRASALLEAVRSDQNVRLSHISQQESQ